MTFKSALLGSVVTGRELIPQPTVPEVADMSFRIGDIVTRDGTDRQRIIAINESGDLIEVECIQEPLGFLNEDGVTRSEPWCRLGERESNLARRYSYPDDLTIEI